jgi:hypothetical protein
MTLRTRNSDGSEDYPTDEFGRATGRNHHYRIPYSDEVAMNIATWTLHDIINAERVVTEWGDFSGNQLRCFGLETIDSKGHIDGLAKYSHSPDWSDAGILTDVQEYRHATGGEHSPASCPSVPGFWRVTTYSSREERNFI